MGKSKIIEGRVARIIDEKTIVLNRGSRAGVTDGMKFAIVATGDEVTDPETGESLGSWELVKGYVTASHVQEKLSVCTAFREDKPAAVSRTLSGAMVDVSFAKPQDAVLKVQSSDVSGRPQVGPIAVGDTVRSVE